MAETPQERQQQASPSWGRAAGACGATAQSPRAHGRQGRLVGRLAAGEFNPPAKSRGSRCTSGSWPEAWPDTCGQKSKAYTTGGLNWLLRACCSQPLTWRHYHRLWTCQMLHPAQACVADCWGFLQPLAAGALLPSCLHATRYRVYALRPPRSHPAIRPATHRMREQMPLFSQPRDMLYSMAWACTAWHSVAQHAQRGSAFMF
jgi:hypothetical protein